MTEEEIPYWDTKEARDARREYFTDLVNSHTNVDSLIEALMIHENNRFAYTQGILQGAEYLRKEADKLKYSRDTMTLQVAENENIVIDQQIQIERLKQEPKFKDRKELRAYMRKLSLNFEQQQK